MKMERACTMLSGSFMVTALNKGLNIKNVCSAYQMKFVYINKARPLSHLRSLVFDDIPTH
jgi:hypothetical protein